MFIYFGEREREKERERQTEREWGRGKERGRHRIPSRQAPGPELSAQGPTRGSKLQTARS